MRPTWEFLILEGASLLIAFGALAIAVWVLVSGQIQRQGIDGLFLFLVCLLIAVAFSVNPIRHFRQELWPELLKRRQIRAAGPATRSMTAVEASSETQGRART